MALHAQSLLPLDWTGSVQAPAKGSVVASKSKIAASSTSVDLAAQLAEFREFGKATQQFATRYELPDGSTPEAPTYVNEFWTSKQRDSNRLHEISYRACFKAELPRFFIERLTQPGGVVYDPFMGRGTTLLEASLLGRIPRGCDINPLSRVLVGSRLNPPNLADIEQRLSSIDLSAATEIPEELLVFYHPETLKEIVALKSYFARRRSDGAFDPIDAWIEMVALNRLTGHSAGFFSVYTLPPNQAVSIKSQRKINQDRNQVPPRRNVVQLIFRKSRKLLSQIDSNLGGNMRRLYRDAVLITGPASKTPELADCSIDLAITSPPFLDVVNYAGDNWLRCWFAGVDPASVPITMSAKVDDWKTNMTAVLRELHRVLKPGGHIAFEIGEVRGGTIRLEEAILPCGCAAGLSPLLVMINDQKFTKTSHCWGVDNGGKGTNTNRIVLFRKE